MTSNNNQKGFTLVEIVLVLVLLGILTAVAVSKYYDLQAKAESAKAYTLANQFVAELNSEISSLMLEGKSCQEAKYEAANTVGSKYTWNDPNTPGTISIDSSVIYTDATELTVLVRVDSENFRKYVLPSGIIVCPGVQVVTP